MRRRQHACLARAGARKHECRPIDVEDGFALCGVQTVERIALRRAHAGTSIIGRE